MEFIGNLYFVQGVFFEHGAQTRMGVGEVRIGWGVNYYIFHGLIERDAKRNPLGGFDGRIEDSIGKATLSQVVLTQAEFRFTKEYDQSDRDDKIKYRFRKDEATGIWLGEYSGDEIPGGPCKCTLTPIPEDFFQPHQPVKRRAMSP